MPFLAVVTLVLLRGLAVGSGVRGHVLFLACACLPLLLAAARTGSVQHLPAAAFVVLCGLGAAEVARAIQRHAALARDEREGRRIAEGRIEDLARQVQRLQIEARVNGELRDGMQVELDGVTREVSVLRSKAGALSSALQRINPHDIETGLLTADKFTSVMTREWARMQRQELPLSLLLVSVDRFEDFRDWLGQKAYEAALKRLSDVFRHAGHRPGDVAARLGPNLFALLYPETEYKYVGRLADGVRTRVRQLGITAAPSAPHKVLTVTVGMATVIPNHDISPAVLRERVEAALYEAQFQGGDRSVRYRSFESIRIEHWNPEHEGEITEAGLRRKLAVLGYDAEPVVYHPGEERPSRRVPTDRVEAIVEGTLKIALEGEARVLKPGDFMYVPKGLVTSVEVVGPRPVRCLQAIRA